MTGHVSLRLPEALLERLEEIAKAQGMNLSAAMRIALQRGVAALEHDAKPARLRAKVGR